MNQEEAKRLFYKHVWPLRAVVLRTARFLTRDAAEADDLAQETLLKAYRSIETFDVSTQAAAWLTAILRNTRIDRARAGRRESHNVSLESQGLETEARPSGREPINYSDAAAMLDQLGDDQLIEALRELPDEIRWTLLLVDVEQLDHAQAATVMGIPVGTVKSRAHRGRQMLREKLLASPVPQTPNRKES
jgi:RNA polymerase sigma-70 factor (ECF subfamily)